MADAEEGIGRNSKGLYCQYVTVSNVTWIYRLRMTVAIRIQKQT